MSRIQGTNRRVKPVARFHHQTRDQISALRDLLQPPQYSRTVNQKTVVDTAKKMRVSEKELQSLFDMSNHGNSVTAITVDYRKPGTTMTVYVYVYPKESIASFVKSSVAYRSDKVVVKDDYIFDDHLVCTSRAGLFLKDGKFFVVQHKDEIALFEKDKDAKLIAYVEAKKHDSVSKTVDIAIEAVYKSSKDFQSKIEKELDCKYLHFKTPTRFTNQKAISLEVFDKSTGEFKTASAVMDEPADHIKTDVVAYYAKLDKKKVFAVFSKMKFTEKLVAYIFDVNDKTHLIDLEKVYFKQ